MSDTFSDFLAAPSAATFLTLREQLVALPDYEFASDRLEELADLVDAGQFAEVADKLSELMPEWLLSPRAHLFAARAAEALGDTDRAQFERDFAQACLRGLQQSGDGSRTSPHRVMHISDEYDLLLAQGKELASQRQVTAEDGVFDVITCQDGTELWFDITAGAVPAT